MKNLFKRNKNRGIPKSYLSYDAHRNNFGDILNPIVANFYAKRPVTRISKLMSKYRNHYFMIGSILQRCTDKTTVWGSGLISANATCKHVPKSVLAVRGPLTRKRLLDQGIKCPEVYGDPALLMPEIYPDKKQAKRYDLGIIAHFDDNKDPWLKRDFLKNSGINIIEVQNPDPLKVIDQILECEYIASSSLHGLIVADAYGIPSLWVEFTHPFEDGAFKFQDYFQSVGRQVTGPVKVAEINSVQELKEAFDSYSINLDLEPLKQSFPL